MASRVLIRGQAGQIVPAAGTVQPYARSELERMRSMVKIDKNELDTCCQENSQLFLDCQDRHSLAISARDQAKADLAQVDAELANGFRHGGAKISQGEIYDRVIVETRHIAAAQKLAELDLLADQWGNLVKSMQDRSRMLGHLTTQYANGYFAVGASAGAGQQNRYATGALGREALRVARK